MVTIFRPDGVCNERYAWEGMVAHNGMLYCAPNHAPCILEVNPSNGSMRYVSTERIHKGAAKWRNPVACHDKVYFTPRLAPCILEFDPAAPEEQSLRAINTDSFCKGGWPGGSSATLNGKVYFSPAASAPLVELDPGGGSVRLLNIESVAPGGRCLHMCTAQGWLYLLLDGDPPVALEVDPSTGSVRPIELARYCVPGHGSWAGQVPLGDMIYFWQERSSTLLELDPKSGGVREVNSRTLPAPLSVGVAAVGKICILAHRRPYLITVDTVTGEPQSHGIEIPEQEEWAGACEMGGRIFIHTRTDKILALDTAYLLAKDTDKVVEVDLAIPEATKRKKDEPKDRFLYCCWRPAEVLPPEPP